MRLLSRFHPAAQRVKAIIDSGELGRLKAIQADFAIPKLPYGIVFLEDDVRFQFELGGGATMDMGGRWIILTRSYNSDLLHVHSIPALCSSLFLLQQPYLSSNC